MTPQAGTYIYIYIYLYLYIPCAAVCACICMYVLPGRARPCAGAPQI